MNVKLLFPVVFLIIFAVVINASAEADTSVIKELDDIIMQGEHAFYEKADGVRQRIERNPDKMLPLLLQRAKDGKLDDHGLAIYIWAIGLTRIPDAVEEIIKLSQGKSSEELISHTYFALSLIGGPTSGSFLYDKMLGTSDQKMRYYLLDLLAQQQYEPAIPLTVSILELDPKTFYWKNYFVFGKFGDRSIPFLLQKINNKNRNIRANAIAMLGQWLIAQEAVLPFKEQYWLEKDVEIRGLILSSLERINVSLDDVRTFSEEVIKKETNDNLIKFAGETIENLTQIQEHLIAFRDKKKNDRAMFESAYKDIYESFGKKGSYENLSVASTKADEQKLKKLREIVLRRNSDECFYDYRKINNIIIFNRML